jgi:hypothetical protein
MVIDGKNFLGTQTQFSGCNTVQDAEHYNKDNLRRVLPFQAKQSFQASLSPES